MAEVVVIEDEFSKLPAEEQARLTDEWLAAAGREAQEARVTGMGLLGGARDEMDW